MLRTFYETSSSKMNVPPIKQHETTKRKIHFLSLDTRGGGGGKRGHRRWFFNSC